MAGGGDGASLVDAVPLGPFGAAQPIPALQAGFDNDDPGLTGDGLELYVASKASGNEDIYVSRRASRNDPWPAPVVVPGMDTTATEKAPQPSASGLTLYYQSADEIMVATRTAVGQPWTIATTGINMPYTETPAVCDDDRVMYLRVGSDVARDIYRSTRASTSDAWSAPVLVPELSSSVADSGPWVSPSCSRIYFDSDTPAVGTPYVADLISGGTMFGTPVEVAGLTANVSKVHDLSLTTDERYLVFSHSGTSGFEEIWETSR